MERQLRVASTAYYRGTPVISDSEFDALWKAHKENRELLPTDPVWDDTILDKVGARPERNKVNLDPPMYSLDNVFIGEDNTAVALHEWIMNTGYAGLFRIEPKIDGLSVRILYRDGKLLYAATRGDGEVGENITANVLRGGLAPSDLGGDKLPGDRWINGEIFMRYSKFDELKKKEPAAANPRNSAAGIIRRKSATKGELELLDLLVHDCGPTPDVFAAAVKSGLKVTAAGGLMIDTTDRAEFEATERHHAGDKTAGLRNVSVDDLSRWMVEKSKLVDPTDIPCDGVVCKVATPEDRKSMGFTSRAPRWAIAVKMQQEKAITTIEDITYQVGRSGTITPVAELTPVEIDGSTVSRATLHNQDQINRLRIMVGDEVIIRKAGAIIPEVVESLTWRRIVYEQDGNANYIRHYTAANSFRKGYSISEDIGGVCPVCQHSVEVNQSVGSGKSSALRDAVRAVCITQGSLPNDEVFVQAVASYIGVKPEEVTHEVIMDAIYGPGPKLGNTKVRCVNPSCGESFAQSIAHLASRDNLNLDQLGGEACAAAAKKLLQESPGNPDPFLILTKSLDWYASLAWETSSGGNMSFGESRAQKVIDAINRAGEKLPLNKWIAAAGIRLVGQNTSKELSRLFRDIVEFRIAVTGLFQTMITDEDVMNDWRATHNVSHHLGPATIRSLAEAFLGLEPQQVLPLIPNLVKSANYAPFPGPSQETGGSLVGKKIVITGTLTKPRREIQEAIEEAGGAVSGSISKSTDYLVAGEKAGSKLAKAEKFGVTVLTESDLQDLISK